MTEPSPPARRGEAARELALAAATRRFSTQCYEHVGLRHIAADAGLDVARVHRMFGSKEALFAACVRRAFGEWPWTASNPPELAHEITAHLLSTAMQEGGDPLQMLVRSVSDPHAAPVLRAWTEEAFLAPAAQVARSGQASVSEAEAQQRAALLAACSLGIAVMRNVMGMSALAGVEHSTLATRIDQLFQTCLAPETAPAALEPSA
ncbi:TetR/AcrR family transcriptional regulator [Azorhizobium doebereinerae]|uniref:TetR/AcrR family transcriptional regulator n=1 Tax=Azorhizobium doebereinerae TaxID=281091 RepID=UPI00041342BE|nr:TetR family transcriptional regulator [Azorhizobium doebereinerae]